MGWSESKDIEKIQKYGIGHLLLLTGTYGLGRRCLRRTHRYREVVLTLSKHRAFACKNC